MHEVRRGADAMTTVSGLERSCQECGEPKLVTREEATQLHIFHEACLDMVVNRNKRRTIHRWPYCIHGVLIDWTPNCPQCQTEIPEQ